MWELTVAALNQLWGQQRFLDILVNLYSYIYLEENWFICTIVFIFTILIVSINLFVVFITISTIPTYTICNHFPFLYGTIIIYFTRISQYRIYFYLRPSVIAPI